MLGADALGPRDTIILGGRPPQLPGPRRQAHYGICKACGLNFTDTPLPGKPLALKATAVLLYVSGLSMNRTAKLLGVSTPTVQAWIEQFAKVYAQKPAPEGRAVVIELDEMWHYLKKSRTSSGSGRLGIDERGAFIGATGGLGMRRS